MSTHLPSGIYYITSHYSGTVVTLTGGDEGTNLTCWQRYDGHDQQWNVSLVLGQYIFQNVMYGLYISFQNLTVNYNPYTLLYARAAPYRFVIEEYKGGFLIASPTVGGNVFNLASQSTADNTPLIFWPLDVHAGPDNAVWFFNSTTGANFTSVNSATSSPSATSSNNKNDHHTVSAGPIAGGVVGGFIVLISLLLLAFYFGRRSHSNSPTHVPPTNNPGVPYETTPFMDERTAPSIPAVAEINTRNSFVHTRRSGRGSLHKPGLMSPSSRETGHHDRTTSASSEPGVVPNPGISQTVASSSSLPPASTAGSRAADSDIAERDPPPVYQ